MRTRAREIIISFAAKNTYSDVQRALLDGKLEDEIEKGVKSIYPVRSVAIRKSQLLQEGVVASDGPTLDEIHVQEQRQAAEIKAKKAAALAAAMAEEEDEMAGETSDVDEADEESVSDEAAPAEEAPAKAAEAAPAEEAPAEAVDHASMTVAELKELLKAAGKPVSGKKADLIARLSE